MRFKMSLFQNKHQKKLILVNKSGEYDEKIKDFMIELEIR